MSDGAIAAELAPNFEQMTTLSWVAGFTERIGIGTAVTVLTNRSAVLHARQLATLDLLSGGRLRVGVGVGWVQEEAKAVGMPWTSRGARAEEHVALMRRLWTAQGDLVEFHGVHHDLDVIHADPRPVQRPIPVYFGGHSVVALQRAGRLGDGWISAPMAPDRVEQSWTRVCEAATESGRDHRNLTLVATERPDPRISRSELVEAYAAAGVQHLQLRLGPDRGRALEELDELADLLTRVA